MIVNTHIIIYLSNNIDLCRKRKNSLIYILNLYQLFFSIDDCSMMDIHDNYYSSTDGTNKMIEELVLHDLLLDISDSSDEKEFAYIFHQRDSNITTCIEYHSL
jgi:hypothetical protein